MLDAYLDRRRLDDLIDLVWQRFEQRPTAATYACLRAWTGKAGRWDDVRPRALDRLRGDAERAASAASSARATAERRWRSARPEPSPYQTLIEVLLHDGETEQAWQLAVEHACSQPLWMALAKGRELDHPLDAVGVYRREVEQLIDRKQAHTYEAAVELIRHIGDLLDAEPFERYLGDIRHRHRPKTKFLGLLRAAGL